MAHQVLVEVLHVPAPVHVPIKLQRPQNVPLRNAPPRRLAQPAIDKPGKPVILVTIAIAPKLPFRHSNQLARLRHRQLAPIPEAQYILKLLHPAVL